MELLEVEDECPAIKALGSLFKLTEIRLWDRDYASVENRGGSQFNQHLKSFQDVDSGLNVTAMNSDDLELAKQMDALGLPLSFCTNKLRNGMSRGKSKDSNKKHLHTNAVPSSIKWMSNIKILSKDYMKKEASPIDFDGGTAAGSCLLQGGGGHTEKKYEGGLMDHSLSEGPSVNDDCVEGEKSLSDIRSKISQGPDSAVCSQLSEVLDRDNMDSECPSVDDHCTEYERLLSDICTKMSQGPDSAVFLELLDHDNIDSDCIDGFGEWRTYWDSFYSRNYFFNIRTQESTWEPPPGMEHLLFLDMGDEPKEMVVDVAAMHVDHAVSSHYNETVDSIDSQCNLGSVEESRKDDRSLEQPSKETLEGFGLAADNFNNSLTTTTLRCCSEPLNVPLEINESIVETSVYSLSDTQQHSALLTSTLPQSLSEDIQNTDPCLGHVTSIEDKMDAEGEIVNTKRKKKVRRKRSHRNISADNEELQYRTIPEEFSPIINKYLSQRYLLFSKFDCGIRMDEEGWFSVTPELIAKHHASRCGSGTIVDCFTGVGGNAIQFAQRCKHVIAIDIDPKKIDYAQHNACIYGVDESIEFIIGDSFLLASNLKADTVFLSPPWGGPAYAKVKAFDIKSMLKPHDGYFLFTVAKRIASRIVMFLPKNVNLNQLAELSLSANPPWSLEVEKNFLNGKLKAITAYFSDPAV